jgi:hypothetical protein
MTSQRFDGKSSFVQPRIGRWIIVSFFLACLYWSACLHWLDVGLVSQTIFPLLHFKIWPALAIELIPVLVAIGVAIVFRIAESGLYSWIAVIIAARVLTGFALFVVLIVNANL